MQIPLDFWHQCVGRHLSDGLPAETLSPFVPTRLKKGVGPNRLGAGIDAFYVACPEGSHLIGKLEMTSVPGLTFHPSEEQSGQRFIAHWLMHEAPLDEPWMIGVISKANPLRSLALSQPPALCEFCQTSGNFSFNLEAVRQAHQLMGDLPWKAVVAPSIHAHARFLSAATETEREAARTRLTDILSKTPSLKGVLRQLRAAPGSGEYEILSWYHRVR